MYNKSTYKRHSDQKVWNKPVICIGTIVAQVAINVQADKMQLKLSSDMKVIIKQWYESDQKEINIKIEILYTLKNQIQCPQLQVQWDSWIKSRTLKLFQWGQQNVCFPLLCCLMNCFHEFFSQKSTRSHIYHALDLWYKWYKNLPYLLLNGVAASVSGDKIHRTTTLHTEQTWNLRQVK